MKQVIVFPRGQLNKAEKAALLEQDIVAIEADDPSRVVSVIPFAPSVSAEGIFRAALEAIHNGGSNATKATFAEAVCRNGLNERGKVTK